MVSVFLFRDVGTGEPQKIEKTDRSVSLRGSQATNRRLNIGKSARENMMINPRESNVERK